MDANSSPPWLVSETRHFVDGDLIHYRVCEGGSWTEWKAGILDVVRRKNFYSGLSKKLPKLFPPELEGTISSLDILRENLPGFDEEDFVEFHDNVGPAFVSEGVALQVKSFNRQNSSRHILPGNAIVKTHEVNLPDLPPLGEMSGHTDGQETTSKPESESFLPPL